MYNPFKKQEPSFWDNHGDKIEIGTAFTQLAVSGYLAFKAWRNNATVEVEIEDAEPAKAASAA